METSVIAKIKESPGNMIIFPGDSLIFDNASLAAERFCKG